MPECFFQSFERTQFLWNLNLLKPVLWTFLSEGRHSSSYPFHNKWRRNLLCRKLFPGSFGKLLSPLSGVAILATASHLTLVKRSKDYKKTRKDLAWGGTKDTETQLPEMGKCRLCQRPTQEIKDLVAVRGKGATSSRVRTSHASRACLSPFPPGPSDACHAG